MTKLPYEIKVGRRWIGVHARAQSRRKINGCFYPEMAAMTIYTGHRLRPRTDEAVRQTFWHEMTHAILYEMENKLATDEVFVDRFAKLLSHAIDSAKFDPFVDFALLGRQGVMPYFDEVSAWPKKKK